MLTAMVSLQVRSKHWLLCVRLLSLLFQCHVIASTRTRRTQLTRRLFNPSTELLGLNLHSLMRQVLCSILSLFSFNDTSYSFFLFFKNNTSIPNHFTPTKKTGFDLTSPPLALSFSFLFLYIPYCCQETINFTAEKLRLAQHYFYVPPQPYPFNCT